MKSNNFKHTELGLIPDDWEIKEFQDVLTGFFSGATPYRGRPDYYKGEIKWITSGELNYNIITDTNEKINEEAIRNTNLKVLPVGTFLFAITGLEAEGTRGSCAFTGVEATTNQSCMALFPKETLDNNYLYHFYVWQGKKLAFKYCQGTKQQSYTAKIARTLPIILPPTKSEQTAIATALSDADTLIENIEHLIAKKQFIRERLIQELVNGISRLKGFCDDWIPIKFDEIISRFSTGLNPRDNFILNNGGENYYVTIKNFSDGYLFLDDNCDKIDNSALVKINERSDLRKEDILLASIGRVGDVFFINETPKNWNINESVFTLRANKNMICPLYLYYIFRTNKIKRELENRVTGSTFKSIKMADLKAIEFKIPVSLAEQEFISKVLSFSDFEISQLKIKLDKYRMLKQGMMQTLLTGKIRLI